MRTLRNVLISLVLVLAFSTQAKAWGFWAHQRINRLAVFTLPPQLLKLYKKNIEYVTEHAVDPDKRRYAMDGEAPRHYIDIDHYGKYPFPNVPRDWRDAVEKFTEDTLNAYGIVPWHIERSYQWLVDAFRDKDLLKIMKLSSDIGHYIGDSNVPLHTTENYNGQMTNQKGIHGLWESRLPELFGEEYNYFIGRATYVEDVLSFSWQSVLESHIALDSVLKYESKLTSALPSDQKYSYENRGNVTVKAYSRAFCTAYHNRLDGMVERRMRASILRVGSIWYSAWIDAGQPDLSELLDRKVEPEKRKDYERRLKIIDRESGEVGAILHPWESEYGTCCGHGMEKQRILGPATLPGESETAHCQKENRMVVDWAVPCAAGRLPVRSAH